MVKYHDLKTHLEAFKAVRSGHKKAEFRYNDRDFQVGDCLTLQEYDLETLQYTGQEILVIVTHLQTGFGIPNNFCVLSIELVKTVRSKAR